MSKKRLIWLPLLCICLISIPAAAKMMAVGYDSTDSPVVEIDEITGLFRLIGGSGFPNLNSLARDDAGRLLSVGGEAENQLIAINPRTGRGTAVLTLDFGDDPVNVHGLAFTWLDDGPRLWAINRRPGIGLARDLFRINLATGVGTKINADPLGLITSITPFLGSTLYAWDLVLGLGELDASTGVLTDLNPALGDILGIQGIAYRFPFWLYGVGSLAGEHDKLYTLDAEGNCELVSTASHTYDLRGLEYIYDSEKIQESVGIGVCWSATDSPVVQINPDTGLLSTIGQSGFPNLNSLARNYEGHLYAVGGAARNQLIRISRLSGEGTLVTTLDFGDTPVDVRGLAFDGSNLNEKLYATNCCPGSGLQPHDLFLIDLATGVGTRINPANSPLPRTQSLTFSGWGIPYAWDAATKGLIWINRFTGAFTYINPGIIGPDGIQGIDFTADGNLYGIGQVSGGNTKLYLLDPFTGAYSLVGDTGGNYDVRGLEFVPPVKLKIPLAAINLLLLNDPRKWPLVDR
jgi:hypothetical protein